MMNRTPLNSPIYCFQHPAGTTPFLSPDGDCYASKSFNICCNENFKKILFDFYSLFEFIATLAYPYPKLNSLLTADIELICLPPN